MTTNLVRVNTTDGVELQGLHFTEGVQQSKAVIHFHGIWGNFYSNPFIDHFAEFYPRQGYSFVSANTRDHDDGSLNAQFEQCTLDINAWLKYLADKGYRKVVLQGHSLGAIKAVYYIDRQSGTATQPHISGVILLSPFDNIPFYSSGSDQKRQEQVKKVKALVRENPDAIVSKDVWDMWLLSARTYLDLVEENGSIDVFPFRRGSLEGTALSRIGTRSFAAVGGKDFAAYPSPQKETEMLSKLPRVHSVLIDGAPHNFAGQEPRLLKEIQSWLKRLE